MIRRNATPSNRRLDFDTTDDAMALTAAKEMNSSTRKPPKAAWRSLSPLLTFAASEVSC